MPESTSTPNALWALPGERLVIRGHRVGERERDGEVVAALGPDGGPPFRVRWSDTGAETLLFPGSDAHVDHRKGKRPRPRRR